MSAEIRIETNPPNLIRTGEKFIYPEGESKMTLGIFMEDGGEMDIPDGANIILE